MTEINEVFVPETHCREDMRVFKCVISQRETETAVARLLTDSKIGDIDQSIKDGRAQNPQYGIISFHDGVNAHMLMRGRLVHIPRHGNDGLLEWELNAESADAAAQINTLVENLKTDETFEAGFYDTVGLADVLEARSEVMCWDRLTGQLSLSHILSGVKQRSISDEILGDSLTVKIGSTPVNAVHVTMEANWSQNYDDVINLAPMIASKFSKGIINTLTCDALEKSWPRVRDKIGLSKTRRNTGYSVVKSALRRLPKGVNNLPTTTSPLYMSEHGKEPRLMTFTHGWFRGCLWVHFDYKQPCREVVNFSVLNTVPVAGGNVRHLKFKLLNGNGYVEKPSASTVFRCSRGLRLLDYAEKVAKAHIIGASRQLEVEFCVPFETLWDVDLDTTLDVTHAQLPGGRVVGKVVSYQLRVTSHSWVVWVKIASPAPAAVVCDGSRAIDVSIGESDQNHVSVASEFVSDYVDTYQDNDENVHENYMENRLSHTHWPLIKTSGNVPRDPSTFRLYDLVESIAVKGDGADQLELLYKAQYPASLHYKEVLQGETFQLTVQFMDLQPKQCCASAWERALPIVFGVDAMA
eukprot:gene20444-26527_t